MSAPHRDDQPFNDPADSLTNYYFRVVKSSQPERDAARLKVASMADNATDLQDLLAALGLTHEGEDQ
jgi:hypothetical protein